MKHSYFVEILTVGLFLIMFFNWHKIFIHIRLCIKSFIRSHIAKRVSPELDLNLPLLTKEQPTGTENSIPTQDPDSKFILSKNFNGVNFTYRSKKEHNTPTTFGHPTHPNAE